MLEKDVGGDETIESELQAEDYLDSTEQRRRKYFEFIHFVFVVIFNEIIFVSGHEIINGEILSFFQSQNLN